MNPPEFPAGGNTPPSSKKEIQLQGSRPPPLRVNKESYKIKKPPLPPHHAANQLAMADAGQKRQPVIIYSVSPKVIHATESNFMSIVQRLTGPSAGEETTSGSGDLSPAARLASIEKTSPSEKDRVFSIDDTMGLLEGVEMGQIPGILSPAPATLPPISSDVFSPVIDQQTLSFLHELSPYLSANNFMPSPSGSGLLSTAVVSPLHSPDLFSIFDSGFLD